MSTFRIETNGAATEGNQIVPLGTCRNEAVIFIHGWNSDQEGNLPRAEALATLGYDCFTFDLLGHGKSTGKLEAFSREDHLRQCLSLYDYAVSTSKAKVTSVVAASYGAYLATLLTESRPVHRLSLRVPAIYSDEDFNLPTSHVREKQDLKAYRSTAHSPAENRVLAAAERFNGDVLLIESSEDAIVPHETVENYRKAFVNAESLEYVVMEGAGHSFVSEEKKGQYLRLLMSWLK